MPYATELEGVIAIHRELRARLRSSIEARKSLARDFHREVTLLAARPFCGADLRIVTMASLILEAHKLAVQEQNGTTIDHLTDTLEHLKVRIEREVLPNI